MEGLDDLKMSFQLTLNEVNLVLAALSELPFKVSHGLIAKLRQEAEQQVTNARGLPTDAPPSIASPGGKPI
ncbi:hypothetical protein [Schlesneria paludicola]|uniref:hypothetical protein n=1 Tax=Schlesneria paludicola TaxID=360056 RepID=UPI00029B4F0F|nr:hypothetical protein [Schlesneria paludicola]